MKIDTNTKMKIDTNTKMKIDTNTKMKIDTNTKMKIDTNTKMKIDTKKYNKKYNKRNTKKYNKRNTKKGGSFLNTLGSSIFQNTKQKSYNVTFPGSKLFKKFKSLTSTSSSNDKLLSVIFNHHTPQQIDIINTPPTTLIPSKLTIREPYILVNSMDKYLLVIYRESIKKNIPIPKKLLHFAVGYIFRTPTKIFQYVEPKIKPGKTQKFVINLYKYELTDKTKNFIKINNVNKKKAYEELSIYINSMRFQPPKMYVYVIKGDFNQGVNLFNMLK
jgi:hypothetical protein